MSAKRKQIAVLRLLRGEDLELVSRQLGVITAAELSAWRDAFPAAGEAVLKDPAGQTLAVLDARSGLQDVGCHDGLPLILPGNGRWRLRTARESARSRHAADAEASTAEASASRPTFLYD